MGKEQTLRTLETVSTVVSRIATGKVALEDVQPQLMQATDMLDEAITEIHDNAGGWGVDAEQVGEHGN